MKTRNFRRVSRTVLCFLAFFAAVPAGLWAQPHPAAPVTSVDGRKIVIPRNAVTASAGFYGFRTKSNVVVRFFAILDRNKNVHVAFDACDVCYQAKRGYRIVAGFAICNNCGQRFPLAAIGTDNIRGGCWPSYLPVQTTGSGVAIAVADVMKKEFLFK